MPTPSSWPSNWRLKRWPKPKRSRMAATVATAGDGGDEFIAARQAHGRKTTRADLPKITLELLPEEVKRLGTDAFERIGQESCTTIERRTNALVELTVVRPKFRAKSQDAVAAVQEGRGIGEPQPEQRP